ncbi:MAG: GtrA family protein [Bacteroidota bacterium]
MIHIARKIKRLIATIVEWFYKPFRKIIPAETFRYGFTGGLNTTLDIFLYWLFYEIILQKEILELGFVAISPHIAAFIIVFPFTFTSGFLMAKHIAFFESLLKSKKQLIRYALTVAGAIFLNYIFLKFFVEVLSLSALIAKIITTFLVVTYSYILQRYFTFQTGKIRRNKKQ